MVGRHVVAAAERRGHDVVPLSRSKGVDLTSSAGLEQHLGGADVVIDVTSVLSVSAKKSSDFFRQVTRNLLLAEGRVGARHHVTLSIIGAREINAGYYAGKRAQEEAVVAHPTGSIVRATQVHEFGAQTLERTRLGPVVLVPTIRSQPVSSTEVAELLLEVAEGEPQGDGPSIAGPEVIRVADMVRRLLTARGQSARVIEFPMPGTFGRGMRGGGLLAEHDSRIGRVTQSEWLEAEEAGPHRL